MQFFSQINPELELFLVIIFSLVLGSFVSFITYRLGNSKNLLAASSTCINCGCKLRVLNLVPLFSYFLQRGKCSNCSQKISPRYPAIELSCLISFVIIYFTLNRQLNSLMLLYFAISLILISMSVIDLEHYFIPNSLQYFLTFFVIILLVNLGGKDLLVGNIKSAFIYTFFGICLWLFFYFAAGVEAIGIDDIKFLAVTGLLLGQDNFLAFMILTGFSGMIFGAIWQKITKDDTFPFAPALCLAFFVTMIFGQHINPVDILGLFLF